MTGLVRGWQQNGVHLIEINNPPVNALCQPVRQGLIDAVRAGGNDPDAKAIAIFCQGRTFCAGADIAELNNGLNDPGLLELVQLSESLDKPVVAALHGHVYGGGVIVALAADYRIAAPGSKFAMPEAGLGLLPTFGGTQYLPRLIGMATACDMIVGGKVLSTDEALAWGMIDRVTETTDMAEEAYGYAFQLVRGGAPKRRVRDMQKHKDDPARDAALLIAWRKNVDTRALDATARTTCLDLLQTALTMPLDQALMKEHQAFLCLLASDASATLRQQFFESRRR